MTPLVRVRGLEQRFGSTVALDGVDLDIAEGEIVGLVGPNGSGKTTLLQIVGTLRAPTAGTIEIAGVDAGRFPFEARAYVMYAGPVLPATTDLRVREYLDFVQEARGGRASHDRATATSAALERTGLAAGASVDRLSTGLRQQLGLAAALVVAPRVLLLDNPFAALDDGARGRFIHWLVDTRNHGTTIIAAVNDAADARGWCARILHMERGRIASRPNTTGIEIGTAGSPARAAGGA